MYFPLLRSYAFFILISAITGSSSHASPFVNYKVPAECEAKSQVLSSLVEDYRQAAYDSKSKMADKAYAKIDQFLFHDPSLSAACVQPILNHYIALCFKLYDSDSVSVYQHGQWGGSVSSGGVAGVGQILETLLTENKFTYLTDEKRKELGPAWTEKLPDMDVYTSLGAYDCSQSQIYIDAHLRPFDLVTTIYHEVDHLLRDKMQAEIPAKLLKPGSTETNPLVDWDLFNLSEEAEAVSVSTAPFLAAISQVRSVGLSNSIFTHTKSVYQIENDFTLFSKNGPVYEFQKLHRDQSQSVNAALLFGWPNSGISSKDPSVDLNLRNSFFSAIATTYFPDQNFQLPQASSFATFFDFDEKTVNALSWDQMARETEMKAFSYGLTFAEILQANQPSKVCQLYLKGLESDSIKGYIGLRFSKIGQNNATRPCMNFRRKL